MIVAFRLKDRVGKKGLQYPDMREMAGSCQHLEGLRGTVGGGLLCPVCGVVMDMEEVSVWVKTAEVARDGFYSRTGVDGFDDIAFEESQREVYRRRKLMYEAKSVPRVETARAEMVLVTHDPEQDFYECRIFYKEPRPENGRDRFSVEADISRILDLRSDPSHVMRTAAGKVEEFHLEREKAIAAGEPAVGRRVFYANEL